VGEVEVQPARDPLALLTERSSIATRCIARIILSCTELA